MTDEPVVASSVYEAMQWCGAIPATKPEPIEPTAQRRVKVNAFYICPDWYSRFLVPSSSGHRNYLVTFAGGVVATCNCPAYQYGNQDYTHKTCKHIQLCLQSGCFWEGGQRVLGMPLVTGARNMESVGIEHVHSLSNPHNLALCPGCNKPLFITGDAPFTEYGLL